MPNHVYIAKSLDGYITDKEGGLGWLFAIPNPEDSDLGFLKFINRMDAILMGRKTFETVCSFEGDWPYPKPTFVLSTTLAAVPDNYSENAEIINGPINEVIQDLNSRGFSNLYIDGGITIQNFLTAGMIDEMIISSIPVLLGGGTPLFGSLESQQAFTHLSTEILLNEIVQSHYKRQG